MLVLFGIRNKEIKGLYAGRQECSNCGISDQHLGKDTVFFHLFFVPLIPIKSEYFLSCDNCGTKRNISKSEYKSILKNQKASYSTMPENIINKDFSFKSLKLGLWTVLMVLAIIVFLFFGSAACSILFKDHEIIGLMPLAVGTVPFVCVLLPYIEKIKKYLVYKKN